ncbi:MAG: hypothetical protein LBT89_05585, partial [Planctomycetaceae bacterium]|nr:hypothetical protein [Planctomycetaceae bacterium]
GLPCNRNYGTGLTYYALYRTLLDLGKVPLMIELPRNSYVYRLCYRRDDGQSGFKNFPYEKGGIAETFQEKNQFKKRINAATQ